MTAEEFAREQGYDSCVGPVEWRGVSVYEPLWPDDGAHVGPPLVIIEDAAGFRMSTIEESFDFLDEVY